jgi:hypothetical protein
MVKIRSQKVNRDKHPAIPNEAYAIIIINQTQGFGLYLEQEMRIFKENRAAIFMRSPMFYALKTS